MKSFLTIIALFCLNSGFGQQSEKLVKEMLSGLSIDYEASNDSVSYWEKQFYQTYTTFSASQRCLLHYGFAHVYKVRGNYLNALEHVNKSILTANAVKTDHFISDNYFLKGSIEFHIQEYDQSLYSFEKSLQVYEVIGDTTMTCAALDMIGSCHIQSGNPEKGRHYYQKAIELSEFTDNDRLKSFLKSNLIAYYLTIKLPDSAKFLMQEVIEFDRNTPNETNLAHYYGNMAYIYTLKDEYDLAVAFYDSSFTIATENNMMTTLMNLHIDRSDLYEQRGDFQKSNQDLRNYLSFKDSISQQVPANDLIDWKIAIASIEKEQSLNEQKLKVVELNHQNKLQTLRNRLVIFSLSVLILILFLIYLRYRARATKRKELLEQRLKIEEIEAELKASQLQNERLINEQLNENLDYKSRDLTSLSIDIGRRNKLLSEILEKVKSLEILDDSEAITQKRNIISFIAQQKSINENLSGLQENIETVNQKFILTLQNKFSGLTHSDIQLCALIKIGLNIKEIATIKGISPKSVEMSRYRLRKKLGLNQGEDLTHFLMNI